MNFLLLKYLSFDFVTNFNQIPCYCYSRLCSNSSKGLQIVADIPKLPPKAVFFVIFCLLICLFSIAFFFLSFFFAKLYLIFFFIWFVFCAVYVSLMYWFLNFLCCKIFSVFCIKCMLIFFSFFVCIIKQMCFVI